VPLDQPGLGLAALARADAGRDRRDQRPEVVGVADDRRGRVAGRDGQRRRRRPLIRGAVDRDDQDVGPRDVGDDPQAALVDVGVGRRLDGSLDPSTTPTTPMAPNATAMLS
jgi:hypothetical protein